MNKQVIGALIGLVKTTSNNSETENTNNILVSALLDCDNEIWIEKIQKEKYAVSPGCMTCTARCGNTDDYDLDTLLKESIEVQDIKKQLLKFCIEYAQYPEALDLIKTSLCFVGYDLESKYFDGLLGQIKRFVEEKK